ncbi:unnamed protein product [Schistosoma curassoni]|uniref:Uncharacterized protein n=1 Tax=Schistosoma curassoni TaxID=6186 RepID=A0A183K0U0_9TREM|nr:unnamed protein product [Schistosoma curassoni]
MTTEKAAREGNMKQLYDTTKKLSGKYSKPERPAKDKEGRPITEIQQQWDRWVEYLNTPDIEAAHTDLPIDVNPPTTEEIRMAIRQTKRGKAAGPDIEDSKFGLASNAVVALPILAFTSASEPPCSSMILPRHVKDSTSSRVSSSSLNQNIYQKVTFICNKLINK